MPAESGRSRASRIRATLPVVAVKDRGEMGILLAKQGRLLREYAWQYLGEGATADEVEHTIERTVDLLLEPERVSHHHALRHATQQLWHECQRTLQERGRRSDVLVDPRVGPLNEQARRVLERLGPLSREAILRAAQGWTYAQQAAADHTSVGTINTRLHRARHRFLQLKAKMESSASALIGFVLMPARRLRSRLSQHGSAVGAHGAIPPVIAGVALVPLVVVTVWSGGSHPRQAAGSPLRVARSALQTAPATGAGPIVLSDRTARETASPAADGATARTAMTTHDSPVSGLLRLLPTSPDLELTAVATLPGVQGRVIVAIVAGSRSGTSNLVQSLDGGATWTMTSGPPSTVTQLALPPNYPTDPRIFGGVERIGGGAPYEAVAFGQPFRQLTALPPGHVAVSSHFDDGDPRLFSASATGVWSISVDVAPPAPPREEIDYAGAFALQSVVATLATPPETPQGPALLAWAPAGSTVPGTPWEPGLNAPLVVCPVNGLCATESFLPAAPGGLTVDGSSVMAYKGNDAFLSLDGGSQFRQLPLPATAKVISSMMFVGSSGEIWLSTSTSDARGAVYRRTVGGWQDESGGDSVLTGHAGTLVGSAPDRVLDVLSGAGYRCTSAAAIEWLPRCPR